MKIMANATSYGIFIELNVEQRASPSAVTWFGPDGGAGHEVQPRELEEPGRHFHPLLATLITGAARLMLATSEVLARDRGIDWRSAIRIAWRSHLRQAWATRSSSTAPRRSALGSTR